MNITEEPLNYQRIKNISQKMDSHIDSDDGKLISRRSGVLKDLASSPRCQHASLKALVVYFLTNQKRPLSKPEHTPLPLLVLNKQSMLFVRQVYFSVF